MSLRSRITSFFNRKSSPNYDTSRPIAWIPSKRGGIVVTHEKALELSTCFACVRVISEDVAKLPWNVFSISGNKRTKLDNQLSRLLNTRPNPDMGAFSFRETIMSHALTWGNGYAEIERDMAGRAVALWLISPDRVDPKRYPDGNIYYEVTNAHGPKTILTPRDVFHLHGIGFDGISGYSMVALAAETLGFAIAAEEHGSSFYGNNTTPGMALKTDAALSDDGYDRLKKQIEDRRGSGRAYEGMILEEGLDFARPNMSQVDAQYIETRRQQVEEVCRWWRVPPHKVSELSRAHFANVENLNIDYATDTLMPWIKRLEEEADFKLIGNRSLASYTKIAIQGLMRGDSAARAAFYKEMFNMGAFSPNMILELEDIDPIGPEGDEHYIQVNMTTLKKIVEQPAPQETAPQDAADPAINNFVSRFLAKDIEAAQSAKERYNREEFADWLSGQLKRFAPVRNASLDDLMPVIKVAYPKADKSDILSVYSNAARKELFNLYDDGEASYVQVSSRIFEVLQ